MYLGIDVGGTKIAAALVGDDGSVHRKTRQPIDQSSDRSAIEQLRHVIVGFAGDVLEGIGVGVPGIADQENKTVWAPHVKGWNRIPLQAELQKGLGVAVVIESDRNTAVLGEYLFGASRGKEDVVFLILGTGIGAGILSSGRLLRGAHDIGGAVGWIPVCFRGTLHHFEEVAAGPAIERIAGQELGQEYRLPELAERARRGEEKTEQVFREVGEVIGQVVAVLVSTLNPQQIVLGGGASNAWDLMRNSAERAWRRWSQPIAVHQVEVVVSSLGENAGILGAAAAVRHQEQEVVK